jgi:hypothetical protein
MKFSAVATPAIRLAEQGFPATPHLVEDIAHTTAQIAADPGLKATYLTPAGAPPKPGDILHEKALGATLPSPGVSFANEPDQVEHHCRLRCENRRDAYHIKICDSRSTSEHCSRSS